MHCETSSIDQLKEEFCYRQFSKNLDLSSSHSGRSFERRICERSGDLKSQVRAASFQSDSFWQGLPNLTHSDKGHPFTVVLAFLRWGQASIWGQTKIVEESDDSRITSTRTIVCHIHSASPFSHSYILARFEHVMVWYVLWYGMIYGIYIVVLYIISDFLDFQ